MRFPSTTIVPPGGHVAHTRASLSTVVVASVLIPTLLPAQGLRLGLLGGTTDLTAGGWSVTALTFSDSGPYSAGAQLSNRGAGAMVELFWREDRAPQTITLYQYVSVGAGYRFGGHGTGQGWGQWNLLAGSRVLPASNRGMVVDVGLGVYGTLGEGGSRLYAPSVGLAGRVLVGWVF